MDFTPRLIQILFLLLNTNDPIPAEKLAKQLQISKRTIFRELNVTDRQLKKYGLELSRKSGIGFELKGSPENKHRLLKELESSDHFDPRNREKRQQKLLLALMQEDELQKIYYYANLLQVSEPTISKDLDVIEEWLKKQNILLVKRAGIGVGLVYEEIDFRKALLAYMVKYQNEDILQEAIFHNVQEIIPSLNDNVIHILTSYSLKHFMMYTTITVQRILQGKTAAVLENTAKYPTEDTGFIHKLIQKLEEVFDIYIGRNEEYYLHIFLQGCRLQYIKQGDTLIYTGQEKIDIKSMVYEMANIFDPALSYELSADKEFIEGMIAHLQPTITRLIHNISVKNPMLDQIRQTYPDVYEKATEASKVIERTLSCRMPEDEIGFLALHFGGAMMRLNDKRRIRRIVDIGVICSSGIGISMLLSSKLMHHFEHKIRIKTLHHQNKYFDELDFLVSTVPIDTDLECIFVNPLLEKEDLDKIDAFIEKYAYQEKQVRIQKKSNGNVQQAMMITKEIHSIIQNFAFYHLPSNVSFHMALDKISKFLAEDSEQAEHIYHGFLQREKLSTQVIEEFEIVFLHTQTDVVSESEFIVVLPEEHTFEDPYLKSARAFIVMLIPEDDPRPTLAISALSNRMFEDEEFLEEIKTQKEQVVFKKIGETLEDYFNHYLRNLYEQNDDPYRKE